MKTLNNAEPRDLEILAKTFSKSKAERMDSEVERVHVTVHSSAQQASTAVARDIASCIREYAEEGSQCVLGLATGSTPVGVYDELVRLHREEGLSFRNVVTFNLDEYYPMHPEDLQSYIRFMQENLFDHIDIPPEQIHIPDGSLQQGQVGPYCHWYEEEIREAGGIDIQLLGIGRTGHIGFNEPGSGSASRTRLITLDSVTRTDAASDFFGVEYVPRRAITMGVGTIMEARHVILMAFGEHKAEVCAKAIEGEVDSAVAASYLQNHDNAQFILDRSAASQLTRYKAPWLLESTNWTEETERKAVTWLAELLGKPILKLTEEDYNESGLQDLLAEVGPAYEINLRVFRSLQETITGWPGGKPLDLQQPGDRGKSFDKIFPKRILVFSPHPDDDVISMGGTLIRLADQGHEVHVAYQTSGNIAVFDDDALRYYQFLLEFHRRFGKATITGDPILDIDRHLADKQPGDVDSREVQEIKAMIRRGEARAACRSCGIREDRLNFLEMPFYNTGRIKKSDLSREDVQLVASLLREVQPHQIYAAGDLTDPHGTHRTCLAAIEQALIETSDDPWRRNCEQWLYRGAWQEWDVHEIDMAVPLSPGEVARKRLAIYKHESQKDRALFPGGDKREFWQRAEQRNSDTADQYDRLGLAEYEAIEGFVRWNSPCQQT